MNLKRVQVPWQKIDEQIVIIHPQNQEAFELNTLGSFVWENIGEEGTSLARLTEQVIDEFDVEQNDVFSDIKDFVAEMQSCSLVTVSHG